MTPKERAVAALTLKVPDRVPTFELEFQLADEMFGRSLYPEEVYPANILKMSIAEKEKTLSKLSEYVADVYKRLQYSIIPGMFFGDTENLWNDCLIPDETKLFIKALRKQIGNTCMIHYHGDGTFAIPRGNSMCDFAYAIADDPEGMKAKAGKMANNAIERNKALAEAGVDCLILCSDYCFNAGPFLSPAMFDEYIQPYLFKIIEEAKKCGLYTIKHTDGNIMPILNRLVECKPDAIHSLDPMAGVDIKEVKRLVGDRVCLCGNVNCALLQSGTDEEVAASAEYCLTYGKPGGGYIFSTSNCVFKGIKAERYLRMLDVWKRLKEY